MVEVYVDGAFKGIYDIKTPIIEIIGSIMSSALKKGDKLPSKISFVL